MTIAGAAILGGSVFKLPDAVRTRSRFRLTSPCMGSSFPRAHTVFKRGRAMCLRAGQRADRQTVQVLRAVGSDAGKAKLVFEHQKDGYVLKKLS